MESRQIYYISKLREGLLSRQELNPQYSLRAYARDLDMDPSTLSQILNGKRSFPVKAASDISRKLNLDDKERTLFVESINRSALSIDQIKIAPLDERFMLDESYYSVIAEWEHYALLDLFELVDFQPTIEYFMGKLNLTESRVEQVLNNLLICGLLKKENGLYFRAHPDIRTTEDARGEALNQAHLEELDLARTALKEIQKEWRDFSSSTLALDAEKLPEAKTIIREFRQKMNALLKNGKKEHVYMLSIQFYPLTRVTSKNSTSD